MGDLIAIADKIHEHNDARARRRETAEIVIRALGAAIIDGEPHEVLSLADLQVVYVRAVLESCKGNKSRAARILGINRRSMYRWLEREAA